MTGDNLFFVPSQVRQDIYNILEEYNCGIDVYDEDAIGAICDYFNSHNFQWRLNTCDLPNMTGGICYYSWIENNNLFMEGFDYNKVNW